MEERSRWANKRPEGPAPTIATFSGIFLDVVGAVSISFDALDLKGDKGEKRFADDGRGARRRDTSCTGTRRAVGGE